MNNSSLAQYCRTLGYTLGHPIHIQMGEQDILFLRSESAYDKCLSLYRYDLTYHIEEMLGSTEMWNNRENNTLPLEVRAQMERLRHKTTGLYNFSPSPNGSYVMTVYVGQILILDRKSKTWDCLAFNSVAAAYWSPDSSYIAYVCKGDVYTYELNTKKRHQLTCAEQTKCTYGLAEFIAQEEMSRYHGLWWSPDSQYVAFTEIDETDVEKIYISDPYDPLSAPYSFAYPRPGKKNAKVNLLVTDKVGQSVHRTIWDQENFPYVVQVSWQGPLTLVVQNRRQTHIQILKISPKERKTDLVFNQHIEEGAAWLNIDQTVPKWIDDTHFLWSRQLAIGNQLEIRSDKGELVQVVCPPAQRYHKLVWINAKARALVFAASIDPTQRHLYTYLIDEQKNYSLTSDSGWHEAWINAAGNSWLHQTSQLLSPTTYSYHTSLIDPKQTTLKIIPICVAAEAEPSDNITQGWVTSGEDKLAYVIVSPPDLTNSDRRYPVLVDVYGGPLHLQVTHHYHKYQIYRWLAQAGYWVVTIDGQGTPNRGSKWESVIAGDFVNPILDDQVAGIQTLLQRYPQMDAQRVGIFGWSFGGYMTALALLKRPDVFKAGVAGAPVVDWLDYDTHYTERYLGLPDQHPQAYEKSNLLNQTPQLTRPLLLMHGTADDNVYFFHSLKLNEFLIQAVYPKFEPNTYRNRRRKTAENLSTPAQKHTNHTLVPLANITHQIKDERGLQIRWELTLDFFQRNL